MSLQDNNTYGHKFRRLVSDTLLGVPDDTFAVPAELQTIPFFAIKNGDLWRWNTVTFIWELVASGSGSTIYSADDTLAGNRIVSLGSNTLNFIQGLNSFLSLDPTLNFETSRLRAYNTNNNGNESQLESSTTANSATVLLTSNFNANEQLANLSLHTQSGQSLATLNANNVTIGGLLRASNLAGNGVGIVLVDNDGDLTFGSSPANTALSNLSSVAVNTTIASDTDNTDDLGTSLISWKDIYARRLRLDGSTSGTVDIASDSLSNVATGTNLSGEGIIPFVQIIIVRSDETLTNTNADQNLFSNTAHDVITVHANTTYQFEITGDFTHGAVSHSIALGFTPTTAVVTRIEYNAYTWVTAVGTATASQVSTRVKTTATTAINLAGANATETFEAKGTITIGATGGTITPQIKFSADPTGTILLKEGARMMIWPIGNDTFISQGNIS